MVSPYNHYKMPHSYNRIWIHSIFATKKRAPLIKEAVEKDIHQHLREQLIEIGCPVRVINGMPEHVHLLFQQNPRMAISDILKQIKGNTSHWINKEDLIEEKFAWQTGYAAYSVSDSQIENVARYIINQKEHHARKSFMQEFEDLVSLHGLKIDWADDD